MKTPITLMPHLPASGATMTPVERLADVLADAPASEGVYLLAFYRDGVHVSYGSASPHGRALHYAGYAHDIRARLALHLAGEGSRLCRAVASAGYELRLVRVWHGQGRAYERALKGAHNLARVCPVCAYALAGAADRGALAAPASERDGRALWSEAQI